MAHLILTGATGLVGSAALAHVLSMPAGTISKLSILSRRPVPMAEGKENIEVIIHKDFETYGPEVLEKLRGAEGIIWAQGISQSQVSKEEYKKITIDYPLAAAKAFSSLSDRFKFVYVSGEGATAKPGVFTPFFGGIKGKAEMDLIELSKTMPSFKPFSIRPAMVDPHNHPEVLAALAAKGETLANKLMRPILGPPIRAFWSNMTSPTPELGKFMVDLALGNGEPFTGPDVEGDGRILPNRAIRRIAREGLLDKQGKSAFD